MPAFEMVSTFFPPENKGIGCFLCFGKKVSDAASFRNPLRSGTRFTAKRFNLNWVAICLFFKRRRRRRRQRQRRWLSHRRQRRRRRRRRRRWSLWYKTNIEWESLLFLWSSNKKVNKVFFLLSQCFDDSGWWGSRTKGNTVFWRPNFRANGFLPINTLPIEVQHHWSFYELELYSIWMTLLRFQSTILMIGIRALRLAKLFH